MIATVAISGHRARGAIAAHEGETAASVPWTREGLRRLAEGRERGDGRGISAAPALRPGSRAPLKKKAGDRGSERRPAKRRAGIFGGTGAAAGTASAAKEEGGRARQRAPACEAECD